jgi:hypothetical protein
MLVPASASCSAPGAVLAAHSPEVQINILQATHPAATHGLLTHRVYHFFGAADELLAKLHQGHTNSRQRGTSSSITPTAVAICAWRGAPLQAVRVRLCAVSKKMV